MQNALFPQSRLPTHNNVKTVGEKAPINTGRKDDVRRMVKENAVMVFAGSGCCMTHVVKRLLQSLGVNPPVYEVEEGFQDLVIGELRAADASAAAFVMDEDSEQFPVVFIGGRWFGGLDRILATHIRGELTPLLKKAGALWL